MDAKKAPQKFREPGGGREVWADPSQFFAKKLDGQKSII
jgi:hypothetical protein